MRLVAGKTNCLFRVLVGAVALSALAGCASPQAGDLSSCEQDKASLLATIREQRDQVSALRERTASLERRLAESETEIARLDPTRQARGPGRATEDEGLNWRLPEEVAADKGEDAARR